MGNVRVPINGATLKWAREVGKVEVSELAKAVNVKNERIVEFEEGSTQPTFNQVIKIAKKLGRPPASFFCDQPIESGIPATIDFRASTGQLSSKMIKTLKSLEEHRIDFLELAPESRQLKLNVSTAGTPADMARSARNAFGLSQSFVPKMKNPSQVFEYWRSLLGEYGILVFQTTGIGLDEFRGLSIHHEEVPLIVVNGSDSNFGRIFTLFHELGHLLDRTSGVCGSSESAPMEVRSNRFAQEFLMPSEILDRIQLSGDLKSIVEQVSRHFKVSKLAAAVRLRSIGRVTDSQLEQIREASEEEWEAHRAAVKATPGGPAWHLMRNRDLGAIYIGAVARGLESRSIGLLEATYLLDAKVPAVSKILEEHIRAGVR